jgi:hypothetical protein
LAAFGGGGQLLVTVDGWAALTPGAGELGCQGGHGSSKRARKAAIAAAIVHANFSASAPVDAPARPNLKFWARAPGSADGEPAGWRLNSALESPHGASAVTAVACHPSPRHGFAATGAADGSLKVWRLRTKADAGAKHAGERPENAAAAAGGSSGGDGPGGGGPSTHWVCAATGGGRADAAVTSLALSPDGSVLAAGHACAPHAASGAGPAGGACGLVALWDPTAELVLLATVLVPGAGPSAGLSRRRHGAAPHLVAFLSPGDEAAHAQAAAAAASAAAAAAAGAVTGAGAAALALWGGAAAAAGPGAWARGASKLAVCSPCGVGVWDLAALRCDWLLRVPCDAAAALPPGAAPFVVCAGAGAGAGAAAAARVATLAAAVRGAFGGRGGGSKDDEVRTCVALFGSGSSAPAFVFDLGPCFGAVASVQVRFVIGIEP